MTPTPSPSRPAAAMPAKRAPVTLPAAPFLRLVTAVAAIFIIEFFTMYALESWEASGPLNIWLEVAIDSSVLASFMLPLLYLLFYRPLVGHIREQQNLERELRALGSSLETRVAERTRELQQVVAELEREGRERKRALEELHYSEQKYSTLVENSPTGIFIQRQGRMVFVNQKLAEMSGYTRRELLAAAPDAVMHPDDWPWVRQIMLQRLAGEDVPEEYETRIVTKAGEVRWVSLRAVLVDYRGGRSTLGNVVDITAGKEAERALAASEERLRSLSAQLLTAQEDERANIARNLHDGVGQSLTAIKFAVESALRHPERTESLGALVPKLQGLITEVRRISVGLRPSILDDLGLVRTLFWQGKEFEGLRPGVGVTVHCEVEDRDVPEPLKIVVFRIVQEALTNAAKHSAAEQVTVSLKRTGGELELAIEDDGQGLPPRPPDRAKTGEGFGINGMRERTHLSGGRFAIESAGGSGTTVRSTWPLGPAAIRG